MTYPLLTYPLLWSGVSVGLAALTTLIFIFIAGVLIGRAQGYNRGAEREAAIWQAQFHEFAVSLDRTQAYHERQVAALSQPLRPASASHPLATPRITTNLTGGSYPQTTPPPYPPPYPPAYPAASFGARSRPSGPYR